MHEGRAELRRPVDLRAHAREENGPIIPVRVADLSADGCRILGDLLLVQGTSIWLRMPGAGAHQARVAWARHGQAGCEFVDPIPYDVLESIAPA